MKSVYFSPAKINLFLHILGCRNDGYHDLQTVFQFIDLYDTLEFTVRNDDAIHLKTSSSIPRSQNLIIKAAYLLKEMTGCSLGVDISCDKKIPIGGGLGGGSSNAATTLVALNEVWKTNLSISALKKIGLLLGADVPIFIHGNAAFAEGIGEKLLDIVLKEPWYVLIIPPCEISTAEIFSDPELTRDTPPITINEFYSQGGRNDCEAIVRRNYPVISNALDWLEQFSSAKLTGTGSCVFAAFDNKMAALNVVNQVPQPYKGIAVKGLNVSPLYSRQKEIIGV